MFDQESPASSVSQSMPALEIRYGLCPSGVEALTNLAMKLPMYSGNDSARASQFWKMSRQLP